MQTRILKVDPCEPDPRAIAQAAEVIRSGGLVGFPTETVYGLAADVFSLSAVARVFEVKGRPAGKPLPVQVGTTEDIQRLVTHLSEPACKLIDAFFPGPLTLVLPASPEVPELVTAGTGTVGIRMADHPVALGMIRAAGTPVVAPSANTSGDPPPSTADEVFAYLGGAIELILDSGPAKLKVASTVLDLTGDHPRVLREGAVTEDMLGRCLG